MILLFVMGLGMLTMMATCGGLSGSAEELIGSGKNKVGVVELKGAITDTKKPVEQVMKFAGRRDLVAIVMRVDSPGGSVAPSQELYEAMRAASKKKPVVVSMGGVAASGGFWVAMAGDYIFASGGSITGSIGVISQAPDLREIARLLRFEMRVFKSGPLKDLGNPLRATTPEDEAVFMDLISDVYDQFVTVVMERRNLSREEVLKVADGRIFSGRFALSAGLIDELGGLYDAAQKGVELARIREAEADGRTLTPKEAREDAEPTLVYPKKRVPSLLDVVSESAGASFVRGAGRGLTESTDEAVQSLSAPVRVQ